MLEIFLSAERMTGHGSSEDEERAGRHVDDRRGSDADFGLDEWALDVRGGESSYAALGVEEADLPQRRSVGAVRVECKNAVVPSGEEEHVGAAFAGNVAAGA